MAKKIFCLRKGKQVFEDRCTAGSLFISIGGSGIDEEAKTCFTCIAQRREAEIGAENPDEITGEQEHPPYPIFEARKAQLPS